MGSDEELDALMHDDHWVLEGHTPVRAKSFREWGLFLENTELRRVAATTTANGLWISTVFLGLDHSFNRGGPPILFETMVFGWEGGDYMRRYSTWDQAERGHARIVRVIERLAKWADQREARTASLMRTWKV